MSVTIMDHLEMIRLKAEHRRLSDMTTGLANFVRETGGNQQMKASQNMSPSDPQPEKAPAQHQGTTPSNDDADQVQGVQNEQGSPETIDFASTDKKRTSGTSVDEGNGNPEYNYRDRTIRHTMSRAAASIRTALDADGVMFPDASLLGFGRNTSPQSDKANSTETDAGTTGSDTDRSAQADEPIADDGACLISTLR